MHAAKGETDSKTRMHNEMICALVLACRWLRFLNAASLDAQIVATNSGKGQRVPTAISITSGRPTPTDARTLLTRIIQEIQKIHVSLVYVFVGPQVDVVRLPKVPPVCLSNLRAR